MEMINFYVAVIATCLFFGAVLFGLAYPKICKLSAPRWFTNFETVCAIITYMSWLTWFSLWVI